MLRLLAAALTLLFAAPPPSVDYATLRKQAEASYSEKSFARAHDAYEQAAKIGLMPEERRWVDFRLADTAWRALPEAQHAKERAALEALLRDETHDRVWAEANESIGDLILDSNYDRSPALPYYRAALDWWAASSDAEARDRFLKIAYGMVAPLRWRTDEDVAAIPQDTLVDAMTIAQSDEDRAHVRYLFALKLEMQNRPVSRERALELLDDVIAQRKTTRWYGRALVAAARMEIESGDYAKALEDYERVTTELTRAESREWDEAHNGITEITRKYASLFCMTTFLPGVDQEVELTWRNIKAIDFTVRRVDLAQVELHGINDSIRDNGAPVVRRWHEEVHDTVPYAPGRRTLKIEPPLPSGAYAMTADPDAQIGEALIVVSDANIITHTIGRQADIYLSDALHGAPIAGARVRVWSQTSPNAPPVSQLLRTDANGIAHAEVPESYGVMMIMASAGARQALFRSYAYGWNDDHDEWRFLAFTDRPAYRPGETVHWKVVARGRHHLEDDWITPAKRALRYVINGPRGKVVDGLATFNDFGSFWADLPLTSTMPLGEYSISFTDEKDHSLGNAELFALEEYKLPEFTLSVEPAKLYRLGDTVEAAIDARYYFGAPVTSATIDVRVHRAAWEPPSAMWDRNRASWQPSQPREVLHRTVRTDANGRAIIRFDTSVDTDDSVYAINACATDSSRREVCTSASLVVMMQRYRVTATAKHPVAAPGDPVAVDFQAVDAKEKPVQATGTVTVTRKTWHEGNPGEYREQTLSTASVTTDAHGDARLTFRPDRDGYYFVTWSSADTASGKPRHARDVVHAQTAVWVSSKTSVNVGYHSAGLELIIDREELRAGGHAPLLIATPAAGRWVLLSTSGSRMIETQLIHLDGSVKLVDIPLDRRHVPDFQVTASSVFDGAMATTTEQVDVSDLRTIAVDVKPDRDQYKPREQGMVTITTRDANGKPVAAEVSLTVLDESVTAIAAEDALDPHDYFYAKRGPGLQVAGELQYGRFKKENTKDGEEERQQVKRGIFGGVVGGVSSVGGWMKLDRVGMPPAPAPPPPKAVAESITVTAEAPLLPYYEVDGVGITDSTITVRHDFRSTAFWKPDITTGAGGSATISLAYPESLTTWRATARAVTADSRFGRSSATARTNLPLLVRLEAPRFFVAGDRSTVSAVINNNGDQAVTVAPALDASGVAITASPAKTVVVPPHGEVRADWTIAAEQPGTAKLKVTGRGAGGGDAMEKSFTVYEHGIEKLIARSGKLRGDEALVRLDLPAARRDTSVVVQVSPSLAVTMIDALPYLIDYPYGCTEQTMSRFLPAAIVARTLARGGLDRREIERRITGGDRKLADVIDTSLKRLYDFQHSDGGWGWWKEGSSDPHMTAYVVWGFAVAREGDVPVDDAAVGRAARWLDDRLVQSDDDPDRQAFQLHALAAWRHATKTAQTQPERRAFDNAFGRREHLSAYSRALLALVAHDFGDVARANVLVRNLENGVTIDRAPDRSVRLRGGTSSAETMATAHWGAGSFWWRWYDSPVESTAFTLQALMAVDPHNELVEPAMNWLVKNRRGAQWNNTRDTAIALLALNDYLLASGESTDDASYELSVNGRVIATKTVTARDVLRDPARFTIDAALVHDANEIRIRRTGGNAPLYFAAEARMTSLEEPITAAGNEIFVKRQYLRLVPRPTLLNGVVYDRVPLRDGEALASGDRVEVVATIETKNDYEYLLFEDLKPAGLEATELRSGGGLSATDKDGRTEWIYQELRDRNVALFASRLPQGTWEIRYTLRAETPGSFHALPLVGQAMYVPEIRANGEETHIEVR